MEENQPTTSSGNGSKKWIMIAAVVAVIIIIAAAGGYFLTKNKSTQTVETQVPGDSMNSATDETAQPTQEPTSSGSGKTQSYKDGSYSATGTYSYHSGTEQVGVKLTLKNGVITDVTVTPMAKAPTSKAMQADFAANYKPMVVGKDIDKLSLGKVSGSSLTPKGFNDALDQIKSQAAS